MDNLLDLTIAAHGGLEKWNSYKSISVHLFAEGKIWEIKGKAGMFSEGKYNADLHKQKSHYISIAHPGVVSAYETGHIAFVSPVGKVIEEMHYPRNSFKGQDLDTQWVDLQPHYFSNYAWWTYFTAPFNFTMPGFITKELEPWQENGETWRVLEVTFPDYIETHNRVQVFYYGEDYLLRRHDYAPDILNAAPSVQYVSDYKDFSGIMIPTKRRIYLRNEDMTFIPEPVMVSIDIADVTFTS